MDNLRKLIGIILLLLIFSQSAFTQSTIQGDVHFTNQKQIDNFSSAIIEIEGNVTIGGLEGGSDIYDLSPLSNLIYIRNGNLKIISNPLLTTLDEISRVVVGAVYIVDNKNLKSLGGDFLSSKLIIKDNPSLYNFCSLQSVINFYQLNKAEVIIKNNAYNPSIEAIKNSKTCKSSSPHPIEYVGDIYLSSQAAVDAFTPTIQSVIGNLVIGGNDSHGDITDLSPLGNISYINKGNLEISNNPQLKSLHNDNRIVVKGVVISNNINLETITGNVITRNMNIEGNKSLSNFCFLRKFVGIFQLPGNALTVSNNAYNPTISQIFDKQACKKGAFENVQASISKDKEDLAFLNKTKKDDACLGNMPTARLIANSNAIGGGGQSAYSFRLDALKNVDFVLWDITGEDFLYSGNTIDYTFTNNSLVTVNVNLFNKNRQCTTQLSYTIDVKAVDVSAEILSDDKEKTKEALTANSNNVIDIDNRGDFFSDIPMIKNNPFRDNIIIIFPKSYFNQEYKISILDQTGAVLIKAKKFAYNNNILSNEFSIPVSDLNRNIAPFEVLVLYIEGKHKKDIIAIIAK